MTISLEAWDRMPTDEALEAILPCNGSRTWAHAMAFARPFSAPEALFSMADIVWRNLTAHQWQEAFDSHPRIGETHAKHATAQSLQWSAGEQGAATSFDSLTAALEEANIAYEAKFHRIFLVCATGKSPQEILALLHRRLHNDSGAELLEAAEQQRRITQLRLRKWLGLPAVPCDAV